MTSTYDLIVVGEGFSGLACAAEASRLGLTVATVEAGFLGGLVVNVNDLEHFGEAQGLSGLSYASVLAARNKKAGVRSVMAEVSAVQAVPGGFEVRTDTTVHSARFVVIASGARLRKLGVPGEAEYEGRGVSHCADCDAPMFTGADVVVAGGGNWALQDAMLLAAECASVHVVHAGAAPTACADYVQRALDEPKIRFHANAEIEKVLGNETGMTAVQVRDDRGSVAQIPALGLFTLSGLEPNSAMAPPGVARDASNHLVTDENLETSVPGLWAIGQVRSGFTGWLKDAVADARRAAVLVQDRARSTL